MKTKALLISGIAAATVLAGGWALAQTQSHNHSSAGDAGAGQHAQHMGAHTMGHGQMLQKMQHMGQGKHQATNQGGPASTRQGETQLPAPQTGEGSAHQH